MSVRAWKLKASELKPLSREARLWLITRCAMRVEPWLPDGVEELWQEGLAYLVNAGDTPPVNPTPVQNLARLIRDHGLRAANQLWAADQPRAECMSYATTTLVTGIEATLLESGPSFTKAIIDASAYSASIPAVLAHAGRVTEAAGVDPVEAACLAIWSSIRSDLSLLTTATLGGDGVASLRALAPLWSAGTPVWVPTKPRCVPVSEPKHLYGLLASDPAIFHAIDARDVPAVRKCVEQSPSSTRDVTKGSRHTPLMAAASLHLLEICAILIAAGADVNAQNAWLQTALHFAAADEEDIEIARQLLEAGADVHILQSGYMSALSIAARSCGPDFVELLLAAGADVNPVAEREAAPAIWAAHGGRVDVMRVLVAHGADVLRALQELNVGGPYDDCLTIAAGDGNVELLSYLLKGWTWPADKLDVALGLAALHGRLDICKTLVSYNADPFAHVGMNDKNALERAKGKKHTSVVEYFKSLQPSMSH